LPTLTFELETAVTAHGQVLDDLDNSWLEQVSGSSTRVRQRPLRRTTDQPLQLVTQRVAEMLCNNRATRHRNVCCPPKKKLKIYTN